MRPDQIESLRYKSKDFCSIELEEKMMFGMLNDYSCSLNIGKNKISVLDIGCGSGKITQKIKELGYSVKGLDFSEEAVRKSEQRGLEVKLCNLDEEISEPDNQFDVVWAGDIIEHVFDPIHLLKEANRVLKKGGILLVTIPNDVGLVTRIKVLFGISYQAQMYESAGYFKHHTFFTLSLIKFMLKKSGFKIGQVCKILNLGGKRFSANHFPSFLYNEMVIKAEKR